MPRKVLNDNYNIPLELDEQNQPESDYDNDLDEDDGHNLNAIPPAPKLQGTLPRNGDSNSTQISSKGADAVNSLDNQRTFADGKLHTFLTAYGKLKMSYNELIWVAFFIIHKQKHFIFRKLKIMKTVC